MPPLHVRAQIDSGTVTGDLQGTESDATDLDLSLVNGSGADHGTFTLSSTEVIWSGTFAGPVSANLASGDFTALGDDGSLMQGRFTQIGEESFALQGTILDPIAGTERPGEVRR